MQLPAPKQLNHRKAWVTMCFSGFHSALTARVTRQRHPEPQSDVHAGVVPCQASGGPNCAPNPPGCSSMRVCPVSSLAFSKAWMGTLWAA